MRYKESETVELKKSTSELKEAVISIAAILNKHGKGTVYFGIKDDGTVIGQQTGMKIGTHFATVIKRRSQQTPEKVNEGLSEGLKTLWRAVKNHPGIKTKDLSIALRAYP